MCINGVFYTRFLKNINTFEKRDRLLTTKGLKRERFPDGFKSRERLFTIRKFVNADRRSTG